MQIQNILKGIRMQIQNILKGIRMQIQKILKGIRMQIQNILRAICMNAQDIFKGICTHTQGILKGICMHTQDITAQGGDQTSNIWISRSVSCTDRFFECRGLHFLTWIFAWKFGDSRQNVFDMYGYSRANSLEIVAVVIVLSPILSVCGSKAFVCIL